METRLGPFLTELIQRIEVPLFLEGLSMITQLFILSAYRAYKLELYKAHDHVDCEFSPTFEKRGCSSKWMSWIMGCVISAKYSVKIEWKVTEAILTGSRSSPRRLIVPDFSSMWPTHFHIPCVKHFNMMGWNL